MRSATKYLFTGLIILLTILAIEFIQPSKSAKATTTYWYKMTPSSCAINSDGADPDQAETTTSGVLKIRSTVSGSISIRAFCNITLPQGAAVNLLRIRTFTDGGLPLYTDIKVYMKRVRWNGSSSFLATADLDYSDSCDDASFSETIDNEEYQYFFETYLFKTLDATTMPELEMIELRYTL